uniref:Histone-lysine N-methyltransferase n=1 Tax=Rhabditophanes sp. KR3021 TaxID=114890 RepID=A0AC35UHV6_9BILA
MSNYSSAWLCRNSGEEHNNSVNVDLTRQVQEKLAEIEMEKQMKKTKRKRKPEPYRGGNMKSIKISRDRLDSDYPSPSSHSDLGSHDYSNTKILGPNDDDILDETFDEEIKASDPTFDIRYEQMIKNGNKLVKVCDSKIHNVGLFAAVDIPIDQYIVDYGGELISAQEAVNRQKEYSDNNVVDPNIIGLDQDNFIDATKTSSVAKFINHSCEANCYPHVTEFDGVKKLVFVTDQEIKAGDELTYDYKVGDDGTEEEEGVIPKIPCNCGSTMCRKFVGL